MPDVSANGIRLEYDRFGDPQGRPLLLIAGVGVQMLIWDEEFCEALAERGHLVIRFDNRDVGLSTHFDEAGTPDPLAVLGATLSGRDPGVPYTLDDMADDAAGLLDALGLESAHVCGASMGGMIAQTLAFRHPERVRSLVSIMSTTGDPSLPQASPEVVGALMSPVPSGREANIARTMRLWRLIGSPAFPFDEERLLARTGRMFDRSFHPQGFARQMAAILAHGSRVERLKGVRAPTLVIHGDADPLIPLAAGLDTAKAIQGAELLVIEGMGHDLPRALWPRLADAIGGHTSRH